MTLLLLLLGLFGGFAAPPPPRPVTPPPCVVTLYFAHGTGRAQVASLQRRLARDPRVASVAYVSPAQALRVMKARYPDLFAQLHGTNPLPPSLHVRPKPGVPLATLGGAVKPLQRRASVDAVRWPPRC